MILQALVRYYETLLEKDKIAPLNYAKAGVSFGLRLREDGSLADILPLNIVEQRGDKTIERPKSLNMPESVVRASGILSNFLWDNAMYLLGLDTKGDPARTLRCFACAKELHQSILSGVEGKTAESIRAFFTSWQPESAATHPVVKLHLDDLLGTGNLVFLGMDTMYAFEDPAICAAWERHRAENQNSYRAQCLVSGKADQAIATTHPKVKCVSGGQSSGTSLVSFNAQSYWSYGQEYSLNAPISEYAAFAYTSALNYLIADFDHRFMLDGDTVVCWAENGGTKYQDAFLFGIDPHVKTDTEVSGIFQRIVSGEPIDIDGYEPDTPFYVLCLSPNAARVSVRFFLSDTFGQLTKHLAEHYRRLEIAMSPTEPPYLHLKELLRTTVPVFSKDEAISPLLSGATLRSILSGTCYPVALYENILIRIRADRIINRARAATIKAYLLKNDSKTEHKEVLTVALNEQSNNKSYVLGRLFSLLEQSQESANPGINATITDSYFDSACATPRLTFPTLLKLNRHHLAKDDKWGWRYERQIGELVDKLNVDDDPYPARLTLDEQGLFILGYYHENQVRYAKKESNLEKEKK
ncbi:MAG: type I-C CRISPR-associated protein Cas8c/Csd1 [Clostridia bacterium]